MPSQLLRRAGALLGFAGLACSACVADTPVAPSVLEPAETRREAPEGLEPASTAFVVPSVTPSVDAPFSAWVIAAAGDIACDPAHPAYGAGDGTESECRQKATAALVTAMAPHLVLTLGDLQYCCGTADQFQESYGPTWGAEPIKSITRPAAGNHEYHTPGAVPYFEYFGEAAGEPGKGWYSFSLDGWRLVALNSNCGFVGGCGPGSPQWEWLQAELREHPTRCLLAYWHTSPFSSGPHGTEQETRPVRDFLPPLEEAGVDVILSGHDHAYERFAPQNALGEADPDGFRAIVVGTGGRSLYGFVQTQPNSEVRIAAFGVLRLVLLEEGYEWTFLGEDGAMLDSGSGSCGQT